MLTIAVQAGGESRRMGRNKAIIPFLGNPLIERVIDRVKPLAEELLITTNQPQDFKFLEYPLISDIFPGKGALGGLYTALYAASSNIIAVVACDMPFVNPVLLQAEIDLLTKLNADVVIPNGKTGLEPFHSVYRKKTCLPAILTAINTNQKRIISWFPSVNVRVMEPEEVFIHDPTQLAFLNINTLEELAQAEQIAMTKQH
ncbi:MAG TPA: molybdenum cofactor guanylyltransferase [Anaerolineaceae bacterium]|nr:molybdenum cofactor guanylyltransferase [Anaerolineaceae bacterium]